MNEIGKSYKIHAKANIKEKKLFNSQENEFQLIFLLSSLTTGARPSINITEMTQNQGYVTTEADSLCKCCQKTPLIINSRLPDSKLAKVPTPVVTQ